MTSYTIVENDCGQYGPEHYETFQRVLRVTHETTVGEIMVWWKKNHPQKTAKLGVLHLVPMEEVGNE